MVSSALVALGVVALIAGIGLDVGVGRRGPKAGVIGLLMVGGSLIALGVHLYKRGI